MMRRMLIAVIGASICFAGAYFLRQAENPSSRGEGSASAEAGAPVAVRMPMAVALPFRVEFLWQRSDAAARDGRLWDMARDLESLIEIEPWVVTSRLFLAQVLAFNVAPFEERAHQRFAWYARALELLDRGNRIGLSDPSMTRLEFRILADKMAKDPAFAPARSLPKYRDLLDRAFALGRRHVDEHQDDIAMRFSTIEVAMLAAAASVDLFEPNRVDADLAAAAQLLPSGAGPLTERFGRFRRSIEEWRAFSSGALNHRFALDGFLARERERAAEIAAATDERLTAIETIRLRALVDGAFESMRRAFRSGEPVGAAFERWRSIVALAGKSTRGVEIAAWREALAIDASLASQAASGVAASAADRARFWAAVARLGRLSVFRYLLTSDEQRRLIAAREFLREG